jgi:predicted  nucleic acid-binding Zn-ribbon protein
MDAFDELLELQTADTEIAQLEHRATHLPEGVAVADARRVLSQLEAEVVRVRSESANCAATIEANEVAVGDARRQLGRLSAQLKTVIAPREAEALQHEMAVIEAKISSIEDESLAALERSEELDIAVARLNAEVGAARAKVDEAGTAHATALDDVRAALAVVRDRRAERAAGLDPDWVARYERRRSDHAGVAISRLVRATCGGCHIDLSTSEVEAVRRVEPTQRECPNCARWLVV